MGTADEPSARARGLPPRRLRRGRLFGFGREDDAPSGTGVRGGARRASSASSSGSTSTHSAPAIRSRSTRPGPIGCGTSATFPSAGSGSSSVAKADPFRLSQPIGLAVHGSSLRSRDGRGRGDAHAGRRGCGRGGRRCVVLHRAARARRRRTSSGRGCGRVRRRRLRGDDRLRSTRQRADRSRAGVGSAARDRPFTRDGGRAPASSIGSARDAAPSRPRARASVTPGCDPSSWT